MEDLIKRSDVWNITAILHSEFITIEQEQILERIDEMVDGLPSAESTGDLDNAIYEYVQDGLMSNPYDRPQGEWIVSCKDSICPICGKDEAEFICGTEDWYGYGLSNYCPNCGARMKGADDEDDRCGCGKEYNQKRSEYRHGG